eukprot:3579742-Pleurochrysis_carterae.AAC.5
MATLLMVSTTFTQGTAHSRRMEPLLYKPCNCVRVKRVPAARAGVYAPAARRARERGRHHALRQARRHAVDVAGPARRSAPRVDVAHALLLVTQISRCKSAEVQVPQ